MCEPNVLCDWLIPCLLQHCDLLLTWRIDFVSLHSFCSLLLGGGWFEKQENATNVSLKKKKKEKKSVIVLTLNCLYSQTPASKQRIFLIFVFFFLVLFFVFLQYEFFSWSHEAITVEKRLSISLNFEAKT